MHRPALRSFLDPPPDHEVERALLVLRSILAVDPVRRVKRRDRLLVAKHQPEARQLLAQSKFGGPSGLPAIVFTNAGVGSYIGADVAAMAEMWEQNLGVAVTVENLEPNYYYDQINSGNHGQLFSGGWCADYPDPENFADTLFHTGSPQNNGGYSNEKLDAILESARVEPDVNKRIAMYQQAEQIIVEDAAALFTTHALSYQLVKPYVKGYVFTPINIPIERYMWLEGK